MRLAALHKENVMPAEVPARQIVRGNGIAELEPDGNVRLNNLRARPDPSTDRRNTVRTREKKEPSVTRIESKWAFRILSELQHGSVLQSELCASLRPASRKTLKRHLCQLERAGLIVHIGGSHKRPRIEFSLSDPLGIAAVDLINLLTQSDGETSK
jgi:DNA-binding HxlR family transcriptional regulator